MKKTNKPAKPKIKVTGDEPPPAPKRLSALAAAAQVLAGAGTPLNAKEIVERMKSSGLWTSPAGKTPWATIYAGMHRSIAKAGDASPFRKAERGKFTVAQ